MNKLPSTVERLIICRKYIVNVNRLKLNKKQWEELLKELTEKNIVIVKRGEK